jgi:hypothetical protein
MSAENVFYRGELKVNLPLIIESGKKSCGLTFYLLQFTQFQPAHFFFIQQAGHFCNPVREFL